MSERLKPCPFCGGEAKLNDGGISTYVACTVCDNRTFEYYHSVGDSVPSAISAWNYRTLDIVRCGECRFKDCTPKQDMEGWYYCQNLGIWIDEQRKEFGCTEGQRRGSEELSGKENT